MKKIRLTTWSQRILKDQEGLWAKVTLEICNEQTVQARGTRERCEAGKEKNPSQALLLQLTFLLPGHIMSLSEKIQCPQVTALFPSQLKKKKKKKSNPQATNIIQPCTEPVLLLLLNTGQPWMHLPSFCYVSYPLLRGFQFPQGTLSYLICQLSTTGLYCILDPVFRTWLFT